MKPPKYEPNNLLVAKGFPKRLKKYIFPGIVVALLSTTMLFSCKKNNIEIVRNITKADSLPSQSIDNLNTVYTDSGKTKILVKAPLVNRFTGEDEKEENKIYFPKGILIHFFNPEGEISSSLTAKYAIYHESKKLWEASDSVVAQNQQGEILNTELLFWDETEEKIYSPKFVKITTSDQVIFGEGFEADQSMAAWTITHVKGTIYQAANN